MKFKVAALATLLLTAGCGDEKLQPVTLDKGPTTFDSGGKCQEVLGSIVRDVDCPPRR